LPTLHIPASAFGGTVPGAHEIRFFRLIDDRAPADEPGRETLTLACEHRVTTAALPPEQEYAFCAECAAAFAKRAHA
jgi:hypothetical protein